MKGKKIILKAIAALAVFAICVGAFSSSQNSYVLPAQADSLAEMQSKKKALDKKQAELNTKLNANKNNIAKEKEYQATLSEKITNTSESIRLTEETIALLDGQIANLSASIEEQELSINKGIADFKGRMRALYMAGDDGMASILLGSKDFYDLLAKTEIMNRVAEHDDKMIDNLTTQLQKLDADKKSVEGDKAAADAERATFEAQKADLNVSMSESAAVLDAGEAERAAYLKDKAKLDKEDAAIESAIKAEIKRLADANSGYVGGDFLWPLPGVYGITSGYGRRWGRLHKGTDISGSGVYGKPIVASNAGKVIVAFTNDSPGYSYGKYVMIDHGGGIVTLYGHQSKLAVKAGDIVTQGQTIGYVGNTGDSQGAHLHFEIRVNGNVIDPMTKFTKK